MDTYYKIAKYVAPKIELVKSMEVQLNSANAELREAESELNAKEAEVAKMNHD